MKFSEILFFDRIFKNKLINVVGRVHIHILSFLFLILMIYDMIAILTFPANKAQRWARNGLGF